jgi:hypothetical protein
VCGLDCWEVLVVVFFLLFVVAVGGPSLLHAAREVRERGTRRLWANHSVAFYFLLLFLKDILPDLLFSFLMAIFSACFSTFLSIASFSLSIACGAL